MSNQNYPWKSAVCKGAFALGSACGHCEKCLADPMNPININLMTTVQLLPAHEARAKITGLNTQKVNAERLKISQAIDAAIKKGESKATLYEYISDSSLQWLESYGYKVRRESHRNEAHTFISWT